MRKLKLAWFLIAICPLLLVGISILFDRGTMSELTIGLMLVSHSLIFWSSFPSSLLVAEWFKSALVVSLLGASKHQDFYLLICTAIAGYLQWSLAIGIARTRSPRKQDSENDAEKASRS